MGMIIKNVHLPKDQLSWAKEYGTKMGVSAAAVIRLAMAEYIQRHKNEPGREAQTASRRAVGKEDL
jgi:hypothetical protein